ncbi:hypothetical protein CD149_00450 [Staphylococcus condimenti]|uniref:HIRAN domain-containing protein n=1 Tax=Staphylococcus condimenti TaxID=70255 RepID=A0A143PBF5_9STAP|nr:MULTISPECIES: HIRAN domain-containing protein [Staphylococcus]AMY05099.1 hypothetical protein A4G25_03800 [Staphylococcus condimenti]APR61292.1 hypothetical protein BTZ13_08745 [Staphylococcus condimenti]MDK8645790.1 HIRAN domain-containing protein [Staphylococcus condimenti]OFP02362.1 hypothetical protein HMPREF3007_03725 [Staphylococcus sp. HMSC065E08]PNZ64146.1 hypothetical protein CD149_00450 [Staphylococcus condimenti]
MKKVMYWVFIGFSIFMIIGGIISISEDGAEEIDILLFLVFLLLLIFSIYKLVKIKKMNEMNKPKENYLLKKLEEEYRKKQAERKYEENSTPVKEKQNEKINNAKFEKENTEINSKHTESTNQDIIDYSKNEERIKSLSFPVEQETPNNITNSVANKNDEDNLFYESFPVVGLNYENRREKLKKMINAMKKNEEFYPLYDDLRGMELREELEFGDKIYEIQDDESIHGVYLEKEPDNRYDANAIKVMVSNEYGEFHIGYIPKEDAAIFNNYVDDIVTCNAYIYGGKYKEFDDFEDKIKTKENPYGLILTVSYYK